MKNEFTKKQQGIINSCEGKARGSWIEHFRHINAMKESPEHKLFMKQEREKDKQRQS